MLKKILLIVIIISAGTAAFAQTSSIAAEKVYKEWNVLPGTKNMVEIFYSVVKCNGVNKINLMVFNDGAGDGEIEIALAITNDADDRHFSFNKKFSARKGVFHKATCESDALSELKITLPDGYDPSRITVKQTL